MITILIILTIFIALRTINTAKKKYGFWLNQYMLHNVFWLMTIILSYYFNSFYVPISTEIYLIFILGLLAFNFSIFFIPRYGTKFSAPVVLSLRKRRVVEIIVIAMTIPQAYLNYKLIQQGVDLWQINSDYWLTSRGSGIYFYAAIRQSVVSPLSQVLIATSFYNNYSDSKKNSHILTIGIAILLGVINLLSTGGGRTGILHLGFMLALAFCASYNVYIKRDLTHLSKKTFLLIISICCFGVLWATINRGHNDVFQEIIDRYTLCTPLFEYYYNSNILNEHTFGCSTFEFFITLLIYPFKLLGFETNLVYNNSIIQEGVYLYALDDEVNAYATEYFNYVRDWGICGIIIGPLILSYLYNILYKVMRKNSFYMLFFVAGVLSWNLESHFAFLKNNCLSIIYCVVLYKFLKK